MRISILQQDTIIKPFLCTDKDLNDFLLNDAKNYSNSLLAVTYLVENEKETIAYFSLFNDRILMNDEEKNIWNKINRLIANSKRRKSYPAIKIGRLAVSKKYEKKGLGKEIVLFIEKMFVASQQKSGCRFATVDAYESALGFYEKMGFKYLTNKDAGQKTRSMYFDLLTLT